MFAWVTAYKNLIIGGAVVLLLIATLAFYGLWQHEKTKTIALQISNKQFVAAAKECSDNTARLLEASKTASQNAQEAIKTDTARLAPKQVRATELRAYKPDLKTPECVRAKDLLTKYRAAK